MIIKIKQMIKKPAAKTIITLFLLAGATIAGFSLLKNNLSGEAEGGQIIIKDVAIAKIDLLSDAASYIETVGTVKAETQIDIVVSARGTVRGLFFAVGDDVSTNELLASLYDSSTLASRNNAQTNYTNMQSNLLATERITDEAVRQAQLGVQAAQDSIQAAQIGLKAAQDNLANAKDLKEKNGQDLKNNAIISFNGYLNTIFSALDQVNYIIKAEGNIQLPYIEPVLGIKNLASISTAKNNYFLTKEAYEELAGAELTANNIGAYMGDISDALAKTEELVDNIIVVLDNTISDENFSSASLTAQKTAFFALRSTVVGQETGAQNTYQALQNIGLLDNQEITVLENAASAAQNQLERAQTGYENALTAYENAKKAKEQQVLVSQSSLDNAAGQLNLAQILTSDLSVKAPISGTITGKYAEIGTEVNPGQKIAQISRINNLKIEVNLPSEDIYRVSAGQETVIGENLKGIISLVDPAADPITRKVKIEISYNNENKDLIPGTFINVVIPIKKLQKTHSESVFVPLRAVTVAPEGNYVFTAVPGEAAGTKQAKKISVITGITDGALIEILDGLNTGDELIVEGAKNLEDGEIINIIE